MRTRTFLAFTVLALPLLGASQCAIQRNVELTLPAWTISHSGPVGLDHEVVLSGDGSTYPADPVDNKTWEATVPILAFDSTTVRFTHVGLLPGTDSGWGYFTGDPAGYPQAVVPISEGGTGVPIATCPTAKGRYAFVLDPDGSLSTPAANCVPQPILDFTVTGYSHNMCTLYVRLGHVVQFGPIGLTPSVEDGVPTHNVIVPESLAYMEGSYITNPTENFWFEEYCGPGTGMNKFDQKELVLLVNGTLIPLGSDDNFHFTYEPKTGNVHP